MSGINPINPISSEVGIYTVHESGWLISFYRRVFVIFRDQIQTIDDTVLSVASVSDPVAESLKQTSQLLQELQETQIQRMTSRVSANNSQPPEVQETEMDIGASRLRFLIMLRLGNGCDYFLLFSANKVVSNLSTLTSQVQPRDVISERAVRGAMGVDVAKMQQNLRAMRAAQASPSSSSGSSSAESGDEQQTGDVTLVEAPVAQPAVTPSVGASTEPVGGGSNSNLDETQAAVLGIL